MLWSFLFPEFASPLTPPDRLRHHRRSRVSPGVSSSGGPVSAPLFGGPGSLSKFALSSVVTMTGGF